MEMNKINQTWKQKKTSKVIKCSNTISKPYSTRESLLKHAGTETIEDKKEGKSHACFSKAQILPSANVSTNLRAKVSLNANIHINSDKTRFQETSINSKNPNTVSLQSPAANVGYHLRRDHISTPTDNLNTGGSFGVGRGLLSPILMQNENFSSEQEGSAKKLDVKNGGTCIRSQHASSTHHFEDAENCNLSIDSWGIPKCVTDQYKLHGIEKIFEWQRDCLLTGKALNGGNLVYSAPTSAGKTLVAEMLMLKRILNTKRKAIYVLPFVSVAREKMFYLQDMFKGAGIRVDGYMGALSPAGGFAATDIAVCTIEKANSLVNRLMEEKKLSSLGMVVIDEMHMIGDGHRGYLLELMLSKIRFLQGSVNENDSQESSGVQIVGMSATLPNLDMLAGWLNADLYLTDYRPVPLLETIKVGKVIMDQNMQKISDINDNDIVRGDDDHVIPLCLETIRNCHSVLIFCPTKQWCERLAKNIAANLKRFVKSDSEQAEDPVTCRTRTSFLDAAAIAEVVEQLRRSPVGLDKTLAEAVSSGVSFHHAGLTFDERDIIEGAFKTGAIRVLVATSTLSSGVNLPARRVILRTPMFHGKVINSLVYKQMTGRAGRKGVDAKGESILICKPSEKQKGIKLLKSHLDPVYSCLIGSENDVEVPGMKRALLEIIAAGVAQTRADVERYSTCTYLNTCLAAKSGFDATKAIQSTIAFLLENEFIKAATAQTDTKQKSEEEAIPEKFTSTQLGSATLASALSPDEALTVFKELQKARRCFVLENELHIVYQVMPIYMQSQWPELDWHRYFSLFEKLPPQYKRVGEIVGVEEGFLARAIRGRIPTRTEEQRQQLAVHKRFYSAMVLLELVNEIPLNTVSRRYNVNKGILQSLQNSASTFAGMVTKFCQKLGWKNLEMLVEQFQSRLSFGVTRELCDLVRISVLNGARARMLYDAGYHTVSALATASPSDLTKLLENFAPFESNKKLQGESALELASKKRVRSFWVTGRKGMTEAQAAELIVCEAKDLVRDDLASLGVQLNDFNLIPDHASSPYGSVSKNATKVETKTEPQKEVTLQNEIRFKQKNNVTSSKLKVNMEPALDLSKKSQEPRPPKEHLIENRLNEGLENGNDLSTNNGSDTRTRNKIDCSEIETSEQEKNKKDFVGKMKQESIGSPSKNRLIMHSIPIKGNAKDFFSKSIATLSHDEKKGLFQRKDKDEIKENVAPNMKSNINSQSKEMRPTIPVNGLKISFGKVYKKLESEESFQLDSLLNTREFDFHSSVQRDAAKISVKRSSPDVSVSSKLAAGSKDRSLSKSSEDLFSCSLDQVNGSLILIDSKEDDSCSFDKLESKKDVTPELISESPFNEPMFGKNNERNNKAVSKFPKLSDDIFDSEMIEIQETHEIDCELKIKLVGKDKDMVFNSQSLGGLVREEDMLENSKKNCEPIAKRKYESFSLDLASSGSSILFESFGSCNLLSPAKDLKENNTFLKKEKSDLSLKLSESLTEYPKESQEMFESSLGEEILEDMVDVGGQKHEIHRNIVLVGTKNLERSINADSEIVFTGSDSFAQALCDIDSNEASQNRKIVKEELDRCGTFLKDKKVATTEKKRRSSESIAKRISAEHEGFRIVEVMAKTDVFERFLEEWKHKRIFSFSVARLSKLSNRHKHDELYFEGVAGVSICLGGKTSYYVDFVQYRNDDGLIADNKEAMISKTIMELVKHKESVNKVIFDAKEHFKVFWKHFGTELNGKIYDPKVAAWLLNPSSKEMTLQELAVRYLPDEYKEIAKKVGNTYDTGSIGLLKDTAASPRLRASVEAVIIHKLMSILELRLASENLYSCFMQTEMPILPVLARIELNGFGFSTTRCDVLRNALRNIMSDLEAKARKLARRPFSISAPDDVAQVLFIELGLPPSGDPDVLVTQKRGPKTRRSRPRHLSTAKGILERLKRLHPLPSIILEWRKVNQALSTVVHPMQYAKEYCELSKMYRIHTCYQSHTVTGRVITSEPCLQNVPKDFDLCEDICENIVVRGHTKKSQITSNQDAESNTGQCKGGGVAEDNKMLKHVISMRSAFVPSKGGILVAADYCQLELRIIAHLSRDKRLVSILNDDGDIFRMIAAETNQCHVAEVTDQQRQTSKHICYGIIYGIGPKALAEKLHVDEETAGVFMERFKNRFVGIKDFTRRTIEFAKSRGYVLTLGGRKRFFSTINSSSAHARGQAERQAVNTTVQGSAADLVKKAMINIENRIKVEFSGKASRSLLPGSQLFELKNSLFNKENKSNKNRLYEPKLVLQLHDELIYDCYLSNHDEFINILRTEMEQALTLEVCLPVKVRTGRSWGDLTEYI